MPSPDLSRTLLPWERFCARHDDHPALQSHTLYAIPERLLDAIEQESPDFLTAREKRFERDLARFGGVGFHCGRPIRFALLPELQPRALDADDRKWQRRLDATNREIDQRQYEQMVLLGRTDAQVQQHRRQSEQFRSRIIERQRGYVGWLLTNPDFRAERDAFFARWKNALRRASKNDGEPISLGQRPDRMPRKRTREFWADAVRFLWKWGLQAMPTPELPLPMDPGLERPSFADPIDLRAAGPVLFIPWYLVIDKDMRLNELVETHRLDTPLSHLEDWLRSSIKRSWGFERFGTILRLYIWIGLALGRRYPDRMAGRVTHLDRALARFEAGGPATEDAIAKRADSIRRTRAEMNRRLEPPQTSGPAKSRSLTRRFQPPR
jgi:hypothetical protein